MLVRFAMMWDWPRFDAKWLELKFCNAFELNRYKLCPSRTHDIVREHASRVGGKVTSANLLVVLIVGTIVGALTGLLFGHALLEGLYLAVFAGFLGTIIAGIARNTLAMRRAGAESSASQTPVLVLVYALIASLAGSAAAMEVARLSGLPTSPVWIGALAGLFSAILMAMLMITYHTNPGESPTLRSSR